MLIPINGNVLIELVDQYEFAATPDKEYSTKTSGFVRSITEFLNADHLIDKRVWFESYKDDTKIEVDGKTYTFVKFDDIKGFNDVEA